MVCLESYEKCFCMLSSRHQESSPISRELVYYRCGLAGVFKFVWCASEPPKSQKIWVFVAISGPVDLGLRGCALSADPVGYCQVFPSVMRWSRLSSYRSCGCSPNALSAWSGWSARNAYPPRRSSPEHIWRPYGSLYRLLSGSRSDVDLGTSADFLGKGLMLRGPSLTQVPET